MVKRGEVWLATLDPTVGSEIQKTRPCLVVSPDDLNDHLRTVLVAPMTSGSTPARFRVAIAFQGTSGLVLPEQSRARTSGGWSSGWGGSTMLRLRRFWRCCATYTRIRRE